MFKAFLLLMLLGSGLTAPFAYSFVSLPSPFGSEIKLRAISPKALQDFSEPESWVVEVDITSTKHLQEKLYVTTSGILGEEGGLRASAFYKAADVLYIGAEVSASAGFDLGSAGVFLIDLHKGAWFLQPFLLLKVKKKALGGGGFRVGIDRVIAVDFSAEIGAVRQFSFGLGFPFDLKGIEALFPGEEAAFEKKEKEVLDEIL